MFTSVLSSVSTNAGPLPPGYLALRYSSLNGPNPAGTSIVIFPSSSVRDSSFSSAPAASEVAASSRASRYFMLLLLRDGVTQNDFARGLFETLGEQRHEDAEFPGLGDFHGGG